MRGRIKFASLPGMRVPGSLLAITCVVGCQGTQNLVNSDVPVGFELPETLSNIDQDIAASRPVGDSPSGDAVPGGRLRLLHLVHWRSSGWKRDKAVDAIRDAGHDSHAFASNSLQTIPPSGDLSASHHKTSSTSAGSEDAGGLPPRIVVISPDDGSGSRS